MAVKTRTKTKKRKPINTDTMVKIQPLTENQKRIFKSWDEVDAVQSLKSIPQRNPPNSAAILHTRDLREFDESKV